MCMNAGFIDAIPQVTQEVFDVIDVIGLDPVFHQHQINRQRINSEQRAEVQDTAGTGCCLYLVLIST